MSVRNILIIVTNTAEMHPGAETGIWLEEFAVPYVEFIKSGFQVVVASIEGGKAPIDPRSYPSPLNDEWSQAVAALAHTIVLSGTDADDFDAVFIPGGHGTMFDFPNNDAMQKTIGKFARQKKVIAAMCHGPAGLIGVTREDGTPLVAGKTMTSFTDAEEKAAGYSEKMPFLLETRLKALGAIFVAHPNWSNHVEIDGKLITAQNPQSTRNAALAVIESLAPRHLK